MSDKSKIEWTDATWNPIRGCSMVSAGCQNCYAQSVAHRFNGPGLPYEGLTRDGKWNGEIAVVEKHLDDPLRWKTPRKIFVNSMSDLFHKNVKDITIDYIWAIMALAPRHTFQILTKRPERMEQYVREIAKGKYSHYFANISGAGVNRSADWPLKNVWLGTSVEDQAAWIARGKHLMATKSKVHFLSMEPLLGPVKFCDGCPGCPNDCYWINSTPDVPEKHRCHGIDWVIIGGESGRGARPMKIEWAESIVDQCKAAGVPVFVKQLGGDGDKRHDITKFPKNLQVREWPVVS